MKTKKLTQEKEAITCSWVTTNNDLIILDEHMFSAAW